MTVPVMRSHRLLDDLVMDVQQPQRAGFIAPIWRLKPTMSVNMIAASRRFSVCTALLVSSFIGLDYSAGVVSLSTCHRLMIGVAPALVTHRRAHRFGYPIREVCSSNISPDTSSLVLGD